MLSPCTSVVRRHDLCNDFLELGVVLDLQVLAEEWQSVEDLPHDILDHIVSVTTKGVLLCAVVQYAALVLGSYFDVRLQKGLDDDAQLLVRAASQHEDLLAVLDLIWARRCLGFCLAWCPLVVALDRGDYLKGCSWTLLIFSHVDRAVGVLAHHCVLPLLSARKIGRPLDGSYLVSGEAFVLELVLYELLNRDHVFGILYLLVRFLNFDYFFHVLQPKPIINGSFDLDIRFPEDLVRQVVALCCKRVRRPSGPIDDLLDAFVPLNDPIPLPGPVHASYVSFI